MSMYNLIEQEVYGFILKMKQLILLITLQKIISLSSYNAKSVGNTLASPASKAANRILENATIAVSLKF